MNCKHKQVTLASIFFYNRLRTSSNMEAILFFAKIPDVWEPFSLAKVGVLRLDKKKAPLKGGVYKGIIGIWVYR